MIPTAATFRLLLVAIAMSGLTACAAPADPRPLYTAPALAVDKMATLVPVGLVIGDIDGARLPAPGFLAKQEPLTLSAGDHQVTVYFTDGWRRVPLTLRGGRTYDLSMSTYGVRLFDRSTKSAVTFR
ncbi:MAG TPA: hypothetical protein VGN72_22090 [Tepidisphaeraceae bacterium]|jgi:hypothetical protein|nr:hypothetical protein [Tepidisphaeraceae bacterium]